MNGIIFNEFFLKNTLLLLFLSLMVFFSKTSRDDNFLMSCLIFNVIQSNFNGLVKKKSKPNPIQLS